MEYIFLSYKVLTRLVLTIIGPVAVDRGQDPRSDGHIPLKPCKSVNVMTEIYGSR